MFEAKVNGEHIFEVALTAQGYALDGKPAAVDVQQDVEQEGPADAVQQRRQGEGPAPKAKDSPRDRS